MAEVVAEPDRLGQILVQAQRARNAAGDAGRLERMREPGAVVVAAGVDEDLGLVLETAERLGVHDPVAVALEGRSQPTIVLGVDATTRLVRADRERREPGLFLLSDPRCEGVCNSPCKLGHMTDSSRSPGRGGNDFWAARRTSAPVPCPPRSTPIGGRKRAPEVTLPSITPRVRGQRE